MNLELTMFEKGAVFQACLKALSLKRKPYRAEELRSAVEKLAKHHMVMPVKKLRS